MSEYKLPNIKFNYKDGKFSISGNEDFVNQHLNIILEFIKDNNLVKYQSDNKQINNSDISNVDTNTSFDEHIQKYIDAGIVHIDKEGNISILKNIPNKNNADKLRNITLIYLFLKKGNANGNDNNLKKICDKNECYDSKTFATILSKEKINIVKKGSRKKWTIELTIPGKKAAIKLLDEMVNGNK